MLADFLDDLFRQMLYLGVCAYLVPVCLCYLFLRCHPGTPSSSLSVLFFDILQTFYREHAAMSHVTSADFIEVVERKTGMDWSKFFEAYLNTREVPLLEYYFGVFDDEQSMDSATRKNIPFFAAKWIHVPDGFNMPVILTGKDCDVSVTINVTTKPEIFFLKEMDSCTALSYNKRYSYFDAVENPDLLNEVE